MFGIGYGEIAVLLILAVVLVGPDRLPDYARDAAKLLKKLRTLADEATKDLREEMGPEFKDLDPRQLNPKALIQKHIIDPAWADDEEVSATPVPLSKPATVGSRGAGSADGAMEAGVASAEVPATQPVQAAPPMSDLAAAARWDDDAT